VGVWVFLVWRKKIRELFYASLVIALLLGLFFFPILLINGWDNIFSLSWQEEAKRQFFTNFPSYFLDFADFWLGVEGSFYIFMILLGFFFIFFISQKRHLQPKVLIAWSFVFFSGILVMLLQQKLLPVRLWLGFSFFWIILILESLRVFPKKIAYFLALAVFSAQIGVQVYQWYAYDKTWKSYRNFERNYPKIPFKKEEKIFSNDLIYQNLLAFYAIEHKKNWEVDFSYQNKPYTYLILDRNQLIRKELIKNYQKIQENEEVFIFKIKQ
ncbi:MAG: hypothetical protein SFU27_05230, partial [Thermonemataceae bacterium]|nr:hypothetical protein [Thermonemataceae bacterium]